MASRSATLRTQPLTPNTSGNTTTAARGAWASGRAHQQRRGTAGPSAGPEGESPPLTGPGPIVTQSATIAIAAGSVIGSGAGGASFGDSPKTKAPGPRLGPLRNPGAGNRHSPAQALMPTGELSP